MSGFRIYLSPPHVGPEERALLLDAFDSNWIAPLGPHVDAFERELAAFVGESHGVALSSGTAALHLSLMLAGVKAEDEVLVSTLTFAATANAVTYLGARPVFVDSETVSWNIDPVLLEEELERRARSGKLPAAVLAVDIYGQAADYARIVPICERFGIPLIEDAAEALGATHGSKSAGTFGLLNVFSFNGNKILTTSGGGMIVTQRADLAARARHLATQARMPAAHYEHQEVGFNYRLSNLLAAVGRAQLRWLPDRIAARRAVASMYKRLLADLPGIRFMPDASWGNGNGWLTCVLVDPAEAGTDRERIREALAARGIEARPVWKPMHLQPVFRDAPYVGGRVAEGLFERGLCLPSGSALRPVDVDEICAVFRACVRGAAQREVVSR